MNLSINRALIREIEKWLDPINPSNSLMNIEILGYGEISTVFGITFENSQSCACKRLPVFSSENESKDYIKLYKNYNLRLHEIGINVPNYDGINIKGHGGIYVNYLIQERLAGSAVCNKIIHKITVDESLVLLELIIKEMAKVWHFNRKNRAVSIGLDGQISNWAIKNFSEENLKIDKNTELYFIDTSTPFIRINGEEQINGLLLLKSAPGILQPILAKLFLADVIGRYYNFRDVIIDLLANLHKEQKPELIAPALIGINRLFENELSEFNMTPITQDEIDKYYKEDKFIWSLYMAVRKLDRFIKTKILRRRYEFILPGKIQR
ncbi:MAG: DUF6206 family protein [Thermodesulfobacteriota bacterium]|nr:DUF6206 family protein [Thermodesulfobacteriota bacterium]